VVDGRIRSLESKKGAKREESRRTREKRTAGLARRDLPLRGESPHLTKPQGWLAGPQTEKGCKVIWHPSQHDDGTGSRREARIAGEPLCPREARVGTLGTGQDHVRWTWRKGGGWRQAHLDALVPHELEAGTSMFSAAPIPPEKGLIANHKRMQEHTHLAWFLGDTAGAKDTGDSCECWPHRPHAGSRHLLDATHGGPTCSRLDTGGSRQIGAESLNP
jgi:hypothetical protein